MFENKQKISVMLVVILVLQILLPTINIIVETGITVISVAAEVKESTDDNGITWQYTLSEGKAINVKPKDKTQIIGEIVIPSTIDGYQVGSIDDSAFYNCSSLTSIEIPESVTSIGTFAFEGCSSLTSIEIPESVTSIGDWAFAYCKSLTSIEIPENVISIGEYAFSSCENLTNIEIPENVTSIGDSAFWGCSSLVSINVYEDNTLYSSEDGILFNKNKTEIICYPAGKIDESYRVPESVESIGDSAFSCCSSLTSIEIPLSVTSIGDFAFYWCNRLTSIEIPLSVISIGDYAFDNCSSLTSIEISKNITSIGTSVFFNCTGLTSINVQKDNADYISIDGVLFNKNKTEIICYPAGKIDENYRLPESVISIGDNAFLMCSSLTSIEIPESVTSIGDSAFSCCSSLTNIEIPTSVTSIGNSAFWGCSSLKSIKIPDSVVSIAEEAFSRWDDITIYCNSNSVAFLYAKENNIPYVIIDDETPDGPDEDEPGDDEATRIEVITTKYQVVGSYIKEIQSKTIISNLFKDITTNAATKEVYKGTTKVNNDQYAGTGMTIKVTLNNETKEYTLVVTGDITGEGEIAFRDMLELNKHRLAIEAGKTGHLTGAKLEAADMDGNNVINFRDMLNMNKARLNS